MAGSMARAGGPNRTAPHRARATARTCMRGVCFAPACVSCGCNGVIVEYSQIEFAE